jgi:hypothetical protein
MNQISEREFRDAIIATKKDAKLVAAAKNDRTNSPESLYREFVKLPIDRQREIINSVSNDYFVAAAWKIGFQLNNTPQASLADAAQAAGKALFFARDEDSVKETIRVMKLYQDSPFYKTVANSLGDAAEIVRSDLSRVAEIFVHPELFGLIRSLDPASPASERFVQSIGRIAAYTRDLDSVMTVAAFLHARRYLSFFDSIATLVENSVFLARDRKSIREILAGLGAGSVDRVLQKHSGNKNVASQIEDVAWKTRNWRAIRNYLEAL